MSRVRLVKADFVPAIYTPRFGHVRTRAQTLFIVESLLAW